MRKLLLLLCLIVLNELPMAAQSPVITENKRANFQLNILSNTVAETVSVKYHLPQASDVSFDIFNMLGTKVKTIVIDKQSSGKHELSIDVDAISNGIYFIKITAKGGSEIVRLTVSH
jgi:hypothetical protein